MKLESKDKSLFELAQSSTIEEELNENYFLFDSYEIIDQKVVFKTLIPVE